MHLHVLDEFICATDILELTEPNLGDNSTKLAASGGDAVGSWTVTSGEYLSGNNEGRGVGTKVLEEVGQAVKEHECLGGTCCSDKLVVSEACKTQSASA